MSSWTHNICWDCWIDQEGDREPARVKGAEDVCCWCGKLTSSGIYKRADPEETPCKGQHKEEP